MGDVVNPHKVIDIRNETPAETTTTQPPEDDSSNKGVALPVARTLFQNIN